MKVEIKTETVYEELNEQEYNGECPEYTTKTEHGVVMGQEEKNPTEDERNPDETESEMKITPHLGELIWVKPELTELSFEKEPELDDPMSFGYFEEDGNEGRQFTLNERSYENENASFTCFYCGNESYCLKKLRAHIKHIHAGPKRIPDQSKIYEAIIIYSCRYCHYRTNDNSLYSNHLRKHLAELPVTKRTTSSKESKSSSGNGFRLKHRFRCPYCSFKTSDNERIRYHMCSSHENQRPYHYLRERSVSKGCRAEAEAKQVICYPCPDCEYCATRSGTLKRHIMAKHTNERPYHCTVCDYQATQNETLRRHVLAKHTKEKPHRCPRCAYSAVQMGTLKYHVKSKHNLLP